MDRESLQMESLMGIVRESGRILKQYGTLFFSLASTLILPLCFMLLAHHLVSGPLFHKIKHNERFIENHAGTPAADEREAEVADEWASLLAFFGAYLLFVLAFSLLSTSAVVYSVASIYTEKPVSYSKVLGIVPTVWKRLLITFLWVFVIIAAYHSLSILAVHLTFHRFADANSAILIIILTLVVGAFFCVHVYISCIWHLASVVTVLEDSFGFLALRRSIDLIRGRRVVAFKLFMVYLVLGGLIGLFFHLFVLHHRHQHVESSTILFRLLLGMVLVASLTFVTLFGMVAQTVFYFACKSYHSEQIDWVALSEHLGAYMGEYIPLKSSIQLETL